MWQFLKHCLGRAKQDQAGQSLLVIAVAFLALLIIIGLAIDLGLMYIERIQLGRACDAAALAGAQELPFEDFAIRRAMEYLRENGYDPSNTQLVIQGPSAAAIQSLKSAFGWVEPTNPRGTITIDCESYEDPELPAGDEKDNSADKIRVYGRVDVRMNFMLLIGFTTVPVEANAVAENISNVDVSIVYDRSGSMEFDTRCYGCFESTSAAYPDGRRFPLPFPDPFCGASSPIDYNGYKVLVSEAEFFSYSTSYHEHDYHRQYYQFPGTFWTMQRDQNSRASGYRSPYANDYRGANMMHMPFSEVTGHSSATADAPRLDYAFNIPDPSPRANTWYVWIRAQCGPRTQGVNPCITHWGMDGTQRGSTSSSNFYWGTCGDYAGACDYIWTWVRLNGTPLTLSTGTHTVNIWGGGPGFRLDKVLVTNDPEGPSTAHDRSPQFIRDLTPTWGSPDNMQSQSYQSYRYSYAADGQTYYMGPPDTGGHTGDTCQPCNYQYGLVENQGCTVGQLEAGCEDFNGNGRIDYNEVCNNINDDLFDDKQPIRDAKEAAKNFVKRLKARFDQIGFVTYSADVRTDSELVCIKHYGYPPSEDRGVWDPVTGPDAAWTWCFNPIITAIEGMNSNGNTNIAGGLERGMGVLSTQSGHYGRPAAAKVIVLMTDGQANVSPGGACDDDPSLWPEGGAPKDCVIYYANQAQDQNIVVYTIGLGDSADHDLLRAVADRTGGVYYFAPDPERLDAIFQQIADQIFLRLVQ
jgi:hypothetical protein